MKISITSVILFALATTTLRVDAVPGDRRELKDDRDSRVPNNKISEKEILEADAYVQKHVFVDELAPPTMITLVKPNLEELAPPKPQLALAEAKITKTKAEPTTQRRRPCIEEAVDEDGNHHLRRRAQAQIMKPCDWNPPPSPTPPPPPPTPPPSRQVRVLFLFTREVFWALFWDYFYSISGGFFNRILNAINLSRNHLHVETQAMINEANVALANSGVIHRLSKAGLHSLTGISEDAIRNLYGMSTNDVASGSFGSSEVLNGVIGNIHCTNVKARRNDRSADLVTIIAELNGMGSGGSSARGLEYWDFPGGNPRENAYLSVVKLAKSRVYYQFAHEIGHNCGLGHDLDVCSYCGLMSGRGFVVKNYVSDSQPGFRTIMAYRDGCCNGNPWCNEYSDCYRIPHFSNPDVNYAGLPTGSQDANSAQSLNHYMAQVAAYR